MVGLKILQMMSMSDAKIFRMRALEAIKELFPECKEEDLYFQQSTFTYIMEYAPQYPEASSEDFVLIQNHMTGEITFCRNLDSGVPYVKKYDSWEDLVNQLGD